MAIRSFSVGGLKGLRRAAATDLGNLVVIAGPNGAGKSSVLDLLRQQRHMHSEPGTRVMFVGPHRTWRSSSLNKVNLWGVNFPSYGALLEADVLPSYQYGPPPGLQAIQGQMRDSSSADDAQAFVKTNLGRLLDQQQQLVTTRWRENNNTVSPGDVPDLFAPFKRLVGTLLPHLDWVGVDDANQNDIRVLFRPVGQEVPPFDIDQLSSGEKAAIALLLPLVERQSEALVQGPAPTETATVPIAMLLDEPELHLHPLLQLQVLEFMRELATNQEAQFIITTHSPTILDALEDDELYLLSPANLAEDNQLSRLTTSQERLEVAREITGSTHLLTRSKPIVFIEGEEERQGVSADTRVISNLLPVTASWALVPGRSRNEVSTSVVRLRDDGLDLPGIPVFGLVDGDSDASTGDEHVIAWPVAMVENFLLDAPAIYEALAPFGAQTGASSVDAVQAVLERVAAARVEDETRLRVQRALPIGRLALRPDDIDNLTSVAETQTSKWLERVRALDVAEIISTARSDVQSIIDGGLKLERFHGKRILHAVYDELGVHRSGVGKPAFALLISAQQAARDRAADLAGPALDRIRLFFPAALLEMLSSEPVAQHPQAPRLLAECVTEKAAFDSGQPAAHEREALRRQLFELARQLPDSDHWTLVRLAAQIGTP